MPRVRSAGSGGVMTDDPVRDERIREERVRESRLGDDVRVTDVYEEKE